MQILQNIELPVPLKAWKQMGMPLSSTIIMFILILLDSEVAMKAKAILKECSQNMKQCESDLSAAYILLISGTAAEYTHHSLKGQYVHPTIIL